MPVEVQAFLLCDSVVQDAQTGKSFIHGVFDRIWVRVFPAVYHSCAAFFRIRFDNQGDYSVSLNFVAPSNVRQETPRIPVAMGPTNIAQGIINIQGLPLPEEGRYEIELLVNGQRVARYMLDAISVGEQSHGNVH